MDSKVDKIIDVKKSCVYEKGKEKKKWKSITRS